jgi:D-serine deaminase-like pyridoxal phosphate-dependent protein
MPNLDALATPCLLVDDGRLRRNITHMQAKAADHGAQLRPHTKTHKSIAIARRQVNRGAAGITVAKIGEAERFVGAGFDDVRIAYPIVGTDKYERVLALSDQARCSFCVDTRAGAEAASAFFDARDRTAEVLMEIDVGHGRCGVPWDAAEDTVALAQHITTLPGLRLSGILTHAGQAYHGPRDGESPAAALRRASTEERDRMLRVAVRLHAADVSGVTPDAFTISIGSTPSMRYFENTTRDGFRITEIRPGNYVFFDATQVGLGAATLDDCALTVLTTVVSRREDADGTRLYLDAGKTVTTTDTGACTDGYGIVLHDPTARTSMEHVTITGMSEEHGWVRAPRDAPLHVGDRVQFVPNHACVTVNTQDAMHLVDDGVVHETLPVDARGLVR